MSKRLLLSLALLWSGAVSAFELEGTQIVNDTAAPFTNSFTTVADTELMFCVINTGQHSSGAATATYNSVSMTAAGFVGASAWRVTGFYLDSPPIGAHDLTVTYSGTGTQFAQVACYYLSGVDETDLIEDFQTGTGGGTSTTVNVTAGTDNFIVDGWQNANNRTTTSGSGTKIYPASGSDDFASSWKSGSGSTSMSYTYGVTGDEEMAVWVLNNAEGGGAGTVVNPITGKGGAAAQPVGN